MSEQSDRLQLNFYLARFKGHYMEGFAILIAADKTAALINLRNELDKTQPHLSRKNPRLSEDDLELIQFPPSVRILYDGDY